MADPKPEKPKPMSKTEVLAKLSEATELSKKQVESVLTALEELIKQELGKKGPGVFQIHGLVKFELIKKIAALPPTREDYDGALRAVGVLVVDLSADFRLRDRETYARWYGEHGAPDIFDQGVYGLTELYRDELREAKLVATPG